MNEVLGAFGIDWRLITIQIVNFSLLMVALWYFVYTPVLNILDERRKKIEQGITDSAAAEKARADAGKEKVAVLETAHSDAEGIVVRAREHAKEKGDSLIDDATQRAAQVLMSAQQKSNEMKEKALKESEAEVAQIAILATEKILKEKA